MSNLEFYEWFDTISPRLQIRKDSFYKIFKYLDKMPDPIIIVETGCLRIKNNFSDGQSTLLFDKYTQFRKNNSKVFTVDIDPNATKVCSENVSKDVSIHTGDSVKYLNELTEEFILNKKSVSLFYLDSFDCDWKAPDQSSQHHLKELVSIKKILKKDTLVVVDDSPIIGYLQQSKIKKDSFDLITPGLVPGPTISGKGNLVHEYAVHTGAKMLFSNYQTGWVGFN
jgi:hypothetical protein